MADHRRAARPQVQPERVGIEADAEIDQRQLLLVGRALERRVILGAHLRLREIDLPALERQDLRVLVGHDLDCQPVEHRQLPAALVGPPVVRIAREDQPLPGLIGFEDERAEADDLRRRRGQVPRLRQRAGVERRPQLVARQDRQVVEQPDARAERRREADHHRHRVRCADVQRLAADTHRLTQRAPGLLVVDRLEGKRHVGGGERHAVGELHPLAQLQRVGQAVGRHRPRLGQPGFELLRAPVDAHQPGLRQAGDDLEDRVAAGIPIEGPRLGPHARNQRFDVRLRGPLLLTGPAGRRRHRCGHHHYG